ncbi:MAG: molecular chaperone DnaJ [Fuerstiella sp.]
MQMAQRDYYEVLGVSRTATAVEIKKSYRKLALKFHPDRNQGDDEAVARFKEASEAFDVLSDDQKRARYDQFGHAGVSGSGRGGFHDVNDIFSAFGDIFEGFGFGGGGGGGRSGRGGARRGASLETTIVLELPEAASGCTRTLEINRRETCETCDGSGASPGSEAVTCTTCGGHGQVVQSQGFFRVQTNCPACRGEGRMVKDPCTDCRGSGRTMKTTRLEVNIPAGVDTGMQMPIRGEGEAGIKGGPRGDLHVNFRVRDHPLFERHGQDLLCRLPVSFSQAALGAEVEIPTLTGRESLTIRAGTQPGDVMRLRHKGMPDPNGRHHVGDLIVEIQVEVPRKVTARQEELLRELASLEESDVMPHKKSFFEQVKAFFAGDEDDDE